MKYGFALSIISICCTCLLNAQIRITSSDVSGYNSASDGDFYITTDTDELYVGLETGSLRKLVVPMKLPLYRIIMMVQLPIKMKVIQVPLLQNQV